MSARSAVLALPAGPGVYRFRGGGWVLYLGRAADLRRRVASYWGDLRDRPHLRRMVPRIEAIEAVPCDSEHEAAWLERNLLEKAKPRWNRAIGGQEVPVRIHLDARAGRLDVVHEHDGGNGTLFGPYLGGLKVRLAVGGLRRAVPLGYVGERLGGFDRDLARVRGFTGTRSSMVDTLVAVLTGDASAATLVRTELAARRDAAASALAFELAARIQSELTALDWVLADQKVTRPSTDDAEVHGWHDGLLVSFTIEGGRMRTWRQRHCPVPSELLDRTPEAWREFAARAASLATALVG